jgi:hypothetical protein
MLRRWTFAYNVRILLELNETTGLFLAHLPECRSVSIFVDDGKATIRGSRGTPLLVGTHDGPTKKYSPILADRWACGRMIYYLENDLKDGGDGSRGPALEMLRNHVGFHLYFPVHLRRIIVRRCTPCPDIDRKTH